MNELNKLQQEILRLKEEKNAIILAHFYQIPEIQDIADFVGDSLALAKKGKESDADIIVLCGVQFMAESAKILSPDKKVLLPAEDAGCPMADMVTVQKLKKYKEKNPNTYIVSYVNTSADVKAETDICVTSSNALKIMNKVEADKFLFLPDKNLGSYIKQQVPEKDIELWLGFCCTHERVNENDIIQAKKRYKDAQVLAHPECNPEVLKHADFIGSTSQIIQYGTDSDSKEFIIVTEDGVLHKLQTDNPDKKFYLAEQKKLICKNMKKTTLQHLYDALNEEKTEIEIDPEIREKAYKALDLMLEMS